MRIFTAITFDDKTKDFLQKMYSDVEKHFDNARYTNRENLHMTIAFIGETDRKTVNKAICALKKTAGETSSFCFKLGDLSSFRRKNKHTVYCKVKESPELSLLYDTMNDNLRKEGIFIDSKPFRPHVTLARQAVKKEGVVSHTSFHEAKANCISLMESTRINGKLRYIPLVQFDLEE